MVNSYAVAFFAGLAAVANAYTIADTSVNPSGNPIFTPETGGTVEAGKAFEVTWNATSPGTVTIYLCKGPSTNCVNADVPFADKTTNDGSFTWNVPTTLEPSTGGQGYGIMLISDENPKIYQWSGQFAIANPGYSSSSSSSSAVSSTPSSTPSSSASASASASSSDSSSPSSTPSGYSSSVGPSSGYATGTGSVTSVIVQPTGSMTVPASLKTTTTGAAASATSSVLPGSAGMVKVGAGALIGGFVAALAL